MEEKLKRIRQRRQLFYNARTADGKQVWLVQLEGDRVLVAPAGRPAEVTTFIERLLSTPHRAFASWLEKRSTSSDFFFLLVRPEGAADLQEFRQSLESRGFATGFDLLGRKQTAVGPDLEKPVP